jgi:hypothetical protein
MADEISRVEYYSAAIPHKAGEGARVLTALMQMSSISTIPGSAHMAVRRARALRCGWPFTTISPTRKALIPC